MGIIDLEGAGGGVVILLFSILYLHCTYFEI